MKMIIAIDFDGTIVEEGEYPNAETPIKGAVKYINELYKEGFGIIINTCREGLALAEAIYFLEENMIKYHYINCNFPHKIEEFGADCRKVSADIYIDDKSILGILKWKDMYKLIKEKYVSRSSFEK